MCTKSLITYLAAGYMLMLPAFEQCQAGDVQWECRPSSDNATWDCSRPGERGPSITTDQPPRRTDVITSPTRSSVDDRQADTTVDSAPATNRVPEEVIETETGAVTSTLTSTAPGAAATPAADNGESQPASQPGRVTPLASSAADSSMPAPPDAFKSNIAQDSAASIELEPQAKTAKPDSKTLARAWRLDQGLAWDTCGPLLPRSRSTAADNRTIHIAADSAQFFQAHDIFAFSGDVEIEQGSNHAQANSARFLKSKNRVEAYGDVFYEKPGLRFLSAAAQLDTENEQGWLQDVDYRLIEAKGRGTSKRVFVESPTLSHYENISYTTCPPDSNAWLLTAKNLTLDQESGKGVARNAKIRLNGVPVLYSPYVSFPLDDRRLTGFLTPSFGTSETTGFDFSIPYYLNLAPERDATITPRLMSKRGLMLGGEFRYLGTTYAGEIAGEILPDDRDRTEDDPDTRGQLAFQHRRRLGRGWSSNIDVHWVSDDNYLDDFGDSLSVSSTRHVEQRATLNYNRSGIHFRGLAQHFNTIDEDIAPINQPYYRVPQFLLTLSKPNQLFGLNYHLRSEYAYFKHDERVHGHRFNLKPGVSLPMRKIYGHVIPKLTLDYTTYSLTDEDPGDPKTPSRTLPTFSLDSGLVFERQIDWFGNNSTQTLEPRVFYLYTPNENQGDLPDFDTTLLDLSFNNMFRENRFTGQDRIGDANQVTLALSSRALDDRSGSELFRASIGQIFYFRDREVQLPGDNEQDDNTSVIITEAAARFTPHLKARVGLQWNPHASGSQRRERNSAELHYRNPRGQIINLGYRFNRGRETDEENTRFEDVNISLRWPFSNRFRFVGRWDYSLYLNQTVEAFAGFEYGPCCWTLRAIARRFINGREGDENTIFMVQLELRGLGKVGHKVEDFLQRGIYGYLED